MNRIRILFCVLFLFILTACQLDSPVFTPTPKVPWISRHGITPDQFQSEYSALVVLGYRLTSLNGYVVSGQPFFSTVWEHSPIGPAWVSKIGMTSSQYQNEFNLQKNAGFHLKSVSGYTINQTHYFAAIWDKTNLGTTAAFHGLTSENYQLKLNQLSIQGFRLRHISGYGTAGNIRFAAIFEKSPGPAWIARHGLTSEQFQIECNQQIINGFRLSRFSSYLDGNVTRFAALWEKINDSPVFFEYNLTSLQYQRIFKDLKVQAYRPTVVVGYDTPLGTRYAAIWKNDHYSSAELKLIDNIVNSTLISSGVPGASIAITRNGRLVFAKGFGKSDVNTNAPMNSSNQFRIASISKPITSTAVMKLVEMNVLSLDQRIFGPNSILGNDYSLNPRDPRIDQITLRMLLNHTSGIWSNQGNDPVFINPSLSQSGLITFVLNSLSLSSAPGTKYAYSNFGYLILGRVIEKVTGQSYETWVKNNILSPVGIQEMKIAKNAYSERALNEVTYYDSSLNPYLMNVSRMDSHGGWIATPIDLVQFMVHVDGYSKPSDLVTADSHQLMMTPTTFSINAFSPYGFGFSITPNQYHWHSGSLPGTSSILVSSPSQLSWAALSNARNGINLDEMMWKIINQIPSWPDLNLFDVAESEQIGKDFFESLEVLSNRDNKSL